MSKKNSKERLRKMGKAIADKYAKEYIGTDSAPHWVYLAVIEGYTEGLKYAVASLKKMEDQ